MEGYSEDHWISLMRRVEVLEKRLLGKSGQRDGQPPLTVSVGELNDKLSGLGGGFVEAAWKKIPDLEKTLSPEYVTQLGLSSSSKAELVASQAERLKAFCVEADQLHKLKDYLQVTEFQGLSGHEKRLSSIARTHNQLEVEVERISHGVREVMQTYQHIILQLSAKCIEWNETLEKVEAT